MEGRGKKRKKKERNKKRINEIDLLITRYPSDK